VHEQPSYPARACRTFQTAGEFWLEAILDAFAAWPDDAIALQVAAKDPAAVTSRIILDGSVI
jgi:predicted RNA polymerase sigma factor